jgi:hypothetical protein
MATSFLLALGVHAADRPSIEVHGEFVYGTNPDNGIAFKICPDKGSRAKDPFLVKHECFVAKNIEMVSKDVESKLAIPSLKNVDSDCSYSGTGTFVVSSFKSRKEDRREMGEGIITIADAVVSSTRDLHQTSKDCAANDNGASAATPPPPEHNPADTQLAAAVAAGKRGDFATEKKILVPLAQQGNAGAALNIGTMYAMGQGVPRDNVRAYTIWTQVMSSSDSQASATAAKYRSMLVRQMTPVELQKAKQWLAANTVPHATAEQMREVQEAPANVQRNAQRVSYATIFKSNSDGSVSIRMPIHYHGTTMSGSNTFTRGVSFNGVDFAAMQGHDIQIVREADGSVDIIQFY